MRDGTWLDKQEFAPLRYHVPGILPEGLSVLAGAPKVGKSWLVLAWALAVASGGRALGALGCEQRHVMYFALEDGDRRMQDRCRVLLGNAWRPRDPIPGEFAYLLRVPPPGLILDAVAEYLDAYGMLRPLVIVDTLGRCLPPALSGESPYSRDYRVMAALKDLVDAHPGTSLLLCHHDRKAVTADFVDSLSGTNGIAGGADSVLVLTRPRGEPGGLLQVTGRDVNEGAYAVSFDGGRWALDGATLADAASAAHERRITTQVTAGLGDHAGKIAAYVSGLAEPARVGQVADAVGLDKALTTKYLARLADGGRLSRAGRGLYGPPQ
jgi:hypothetical protein